MLRCTSEMNSYTYAMHTGSTIKISVSSEFEKMEKSRCNQHFKGTFIFYKSIKGTNLSIFYGPNIFYLQINSKLEDYFEHCRDDCNCNLKFIVLKNIDLLIFMYKIYKKYIDLGKEIESRFISN